MTGVILFLFGSVLEWFGLYAAIRAFGFLGKVVAEKSQTIPGKAAMRSAGRYALIAAVSLLVGSIFLKVPVPGVLGQPVQLGHLNLPLIWIAAPFTFWMAIAAVIEVVWAFLKGLIQPERRKALAQAAFFWIVFGLVGVYFYKTNSINSIDVFHGYIALDWVTGFGIILLAVAAVFAMGLAGQAAKARGWGKVVVTHVTLIIGSAIFGLPLLWLVITSFKEDVDMASPNGIVWVPRVQDTVAFNDPIDPWYFGTQDGQQFVGDIQSHNPDGTVTINVIHPMSIAGRTFVARMSDLKEVSKPARIVTSVYKGTPIKAMVAQDLPDGSLRLRIMTPSNLAGQEYHALAGQTTPVRHIGLKLSNYPDALDYLPPETDYGLAYLKNTLELVILSVIGTLFSSAFVAYGFARLKFPGKKWIFMLVLSTMMLPGAVTMLPQFLIFRSLGWIDSLKPLWVPAFFGSAFNIFLLNQFFSQVPMELEDAAKIDGCSYLRSFWKVMAPQIKPALAVIGIWTFMGAWNNYMGPLIYISSPEKMPVTYALALYNGDRVGEPGLLMAFTTMSMLPVLLLFFFAQRYFIEGVTLSGLGGR